MTDTHIIRLVIALLGGVALVGLMGTIALIAVGTDAATVAVIATLTGGAIGNLGSMLARPGERGEERPRAADLDGNLSAA